MNLISRLSILILVLLNLNIAFSQNTISGKITEKDSGKTIPGVNVFIHELSAGTATDKNGFYTLTNLPNGELILHFSFVGYKTLHKKVFLKNNQLTINNELEPMVIESDEVVVSGNFTSTQHDNTIKISTVSISEISRSANPTLMGTITKTPGLNLISKGPGVVSPVIRGLSLNNILVLNNGIPQESFQFSENHPYMIDENSLERVEIIKGPASLIYGSGAIGGVINMIPEAVTPQGTIKGSYDLKYFTNTVGIASNLNIKGNQNGFVWGLGGGINSHKDYLQGNKLSAANTRFNTYSVKANAGKISKIGIFRVFYNYTQSNYGMAVAPALSNINDNDRKNKIWYQHLTDNQIASKNSLFLGTLKMDIDLSYQHNNRQLNGDPEDDHFTMVNATLQSFTYRIKSTHSISEKAKYILGFQGMYQNNKNNDAPDHVIPDATVNDFSLYGLFQYDFSKLKLEAGLRYSYRNIDVPYQMAGGEHDHEDEEEEDHEEEEEYIQFDNLYDNLSASIGLSWKVNEMNILRLNLASAFRSPNLAELTQHGKHGVRYEEGNPNLQMQQNLEGDIGYHLHTQHTTLDIAIFYNYIFNYIYLAPSADTTDDGDKIYRYTQNSAKLFGGEASLHIHPHPLDWLHLVATYSQVAGILTNGEYLPRIPANDLYLEIRLEKDKWKIFQHIYLEGGINFVFAQNHPSEFEQTTSGYNLVNLGFGFNIPLRNSSLQFYTKATNLFNIDYYDHLSTLRDLNIYNMGRNFVIGIKLPFNIKN